MVSSAVDAVAVLKCLPQKRLANPRFGVVMAAIAAVVPCGINTKSSVQAATTPLSPAASAGPIPKLPGVVLQLAQHVAHASFSSHTNLVMLVL